VTHTFWRPMRGVLALALAYLFVATAFNGTGRIVTDTSTSPPTHQIVGQIRDTLPAIGIAAFALASISIGMWKRWSFEIVGWAVLLAFIAGGLILS
jgi:hypothetical protein